MQPWRVLVLIQVASLRSATTSARPKKTKLHTTKKAGFGLLFFRCIKIYRGLKRAGRDINFPIKIYAFTSRGATKCTILKKVHFWTNFKIGY